MQPILAAIDFSPVSDRVVALATDLAKRTGARLVLLHVAAPEPDFVGYDAGPQTVRDQRAAELRREHTGLQDRAAAIRESGVDAASRLVEGSQAETIVEEAGRLDAQMIVIGSHGRSALYKIVLGSISEAVVRQAKCPVLIVPAQASASA